MVSCKTHILGALSLGLLVLLEACGPAVVKLPAQDKPAASSPKDQTMPAPAMDDAGTPAPQDAPDLGALDQGIPQDQPRVYSVAVISDLNGGYGSTTYQDEVHEAITWIKDSLRPDLVLSTGDMIAGQRAGLDHRAMWRAFDQAVSSPLTNAQIPFAPTPGNHDASGYAAFEGERALYIEQWHKQKPALEFVEDTYYPLHYAFVLGPALFISLDDTTTGPLGGPQMRWLEQQLQRHADKPIKIVYGHLPLYAFTQGRESEVIGDDALEQLLVDYDVTMFISGHHHAYYPGRRGALRMVSTACLGSGPRRLIGDELRSERSVLVFYYSQEGILSLDAHRAQGAWQETIAREALPPMLEHDDTIISRDDL